MDMEKLRQDWLEQVCRKTRGNGKFPGKRKGGYLHFDLRIPVISDEITNNVWNPDWVAKHSFYPFIRFVKSTWRYMHSKEGSPKKKEFKLKDRPIDFAAHMDALVYSWYSAILLDLYEFELKRRAISDVAIAYRSLNGKSNIEFAGDIIEFVRAHPEYTALTFDVSKFFETIDHIKLKNQWSKLLGVQSLPADHYRVFKSLTQYCYVGIEQLHKVFGFEQIDHAKRRRVCGSAELREKVCNSGLLIKNSNSREENGKKYTVGIPQGTSLSCVLANIYMIDFDEAVQGLVNSIGGLYRRYSDDIIVVIPSDQSDKMKSFIPKEMEKINLAINNGKTEDRHFTVVKGKLVSFNGVTLKASPLQYLGIMFDGEDSLLRHAGIARFQRRRNQVIRHILKKLPVGRHVPKKEFIQKFTNEGRENYLVYAKRAKRILNSKKIGRQISWKRTSQQLQKQIDKSLKIK